MLCLRLWWWPPFVRFFKRVMVFIWEVVTAVQCISFLGNQTFNDIFVKYWQITIVGSGIIKYCSNTLPNRNVKLPNCITTAKCLILITHNLTLIIGTHSDMIRNVLTKYK